MKYKINKKNSFKKLLAPLLVVSLLTVSGCDVNDNYKMNDEKISLTNELNININYEDEIKFLDELYNYYNFIKNNNNFNKKESTLFKNNLNDEEVYNLYYRNSEKIARLYELKIDYCKIDKYRIVEELNNVFISYQYATELNLKEWYQLFGTLQLALPTTEESLVDYYYNLAIQTHVQGCESNHYINENGELYCEELNKTLKIKF